MIKWFERKRLVKRGLACDKTRRRVEGITWRDYLDCSDGVRLMLLGVFITLLYIISYWGQQYSSYEIPLLTFIMFISAMMYVQMDLPDVWESNSRLVLLFGVIWFNLAFVKGLFVWVPEAGALLPNQLYFLAPLAFAPLLIAMLMGARTGMFAVLAMSLLMSLVMMKDFSLLFITLITGFVAVYFARGARKRGDLVKAGLAIGVSSLICAVGFGLISEHTYLNLAQQAVIGIFVGVSTALIVSAILPIFENFFGIITDISWIEMADLNHPLLQQMTLEAPGTYHHSLMVANLAEAGAKSIGLSGTELRVYAYFHDIGKMIKPEYFAENITPENSPHDSLSPSMSALIIIAHVKEGVDLALKFGLKKPIIDAIQQHHGDSLVYYFYHRAKQQELDAREGSKILDAREDDVPTVNENSFRYPGPRPQTKQNGILALADTIEAASRSLQKPTPARIESFVHELVDERIADGLLDESHLTLNEIRTAADTFAFTLKSMLHSRISYPKDERVGRPPSRSGKRTPTPQPSESHAKPAPEQPATQSAPAAARTETSS